MSTLAIILFGPWILGLAVPVLMLLLQFVRSLVRSLRAMRADTACASAVAHPTFPAIPLP